MTTRGTLVAEPFGELSDGRAVTRFVLALGAVQVGILDWGAALQSVHVPDSAGQASSVLLGFSDAAGYEAHEGYLGAAIGRYGNRIAGGRFHLNGTEYVLACNQDGNNLHGGPEGFDRRLWRAEPLPEGALPRLRLHLVSPDGDQGFPGRLSVSVEYALQLTPAGSARLWIRYQATNDEPEGGLSTVVNLTNHAYFNLAGEGSGTVEDQVLQILADRYTPVDPHLIPLGKLDEVAGTPLDFRRPMPIGARLREGHEQLVRAHGYDHNWVLVQDPDEADLLALSESPGCPDHWRLQRALHAQDPGTGRTLDVWTDRPGVQVYTGNGLNGTLVGVSGRAYRAGDAFTAETQDFPDAPNQPTFPSTVLAAQQTLVSYTVYEFGTTHGSGTA